MTNKKRAFHRTILPCLFVLCLLLSACGGKESGISVKNDLGFDLQELYIAPADNNEWGDNLLSQELKQGGGINLMLSKLAGAEVSKDGAVFDIFAEDEDGDTYCIYNVLLMDGDSLALTFPGGDIALATVTPKKGDARTTTGSFVPKEPEDETNYFEGYWIAPNDDYIVYVFDAYGGFSAFDRETGDQIATGSYTFSGTEGVITAAEGDDEPVSVNATIVNEDELRLELDGEQISMNRTDASVLEPIPTEPDPTDPVEDNDRTYTTDDDGKIRYRDYDIGLWAAYPGWMDVHEDYFYDAVLVYDGEGGYVTYRDVSEEYFAYSGADDEFTAQYMDSYALSDYTALYESDGLDYTNFELLTSTTEGRLGTAEVNIYSTNYDIQVRCILYTATYENGDTRVIAKTMFANFGDDAQMQNFVDDVRGGACRH